MHEKWLSRVRDNSGITLTCAWCKGARCLDVKVCLSKRRNKECVCVCVWVMSFQMALWDDYQSLPRICVQTSATFHRFYAKSGGIILTYKKAGSRLNTYSERVAFHPLNTHTYCLPHILCMCSEKTLQMSSFPFCRGYLNCSTLRNLVQSPRAYVLPTPNSLRQRTKQRHILYSVLCTWVQSPCASQRIWCWGMNQPLLNTQTRTESQAQYSKALGPYDWSHS